MANPRETTKRKGTGAGERAAPGNGVASDVAAVASRATQTSEGQRLLQARPESFGDLAEMLGTNKGSVHRWASGAKSPGPAARALLEEKLGIPPMAWSEKARIVRAHDAAAAAASSTNAAATIAREAARQSAATSTLSELRRLHRRIQEIDLNELMPEVVVRVCDSEARVLALIHKAEQDERKVAAEAEDRLCDHPSFRRVTKALVGALRPFGPDALRAAVEAINGATGDTQAA